MSGIEFFPLRISPHMKVLKLDQMIRGRDSKGELIRNEAGRPIGLPIRGFDRDGSPIGLPTIFPPIHYRNKRSGAKNRKQTDTVKRPEPMIPGYVYVGFETADDYHRLIRREIAEQTGRLKLLGTWDERERRVKRCALTAQQIAELEALAARGTDGAQTQIYKSLKVGEDVRIADWYDKGGAWAGQTAKLVRIKKAKAWVLLQFFDGLLEVPIAVGALEPA